MKDKILYYPYINVPYNNWVLRNLLYWDEVGAIVPYEFIEDPSRLGRDMREMVQSGLVTQVIPEIYEHTEREDFTSAFIQLVEQEILPYRNGQHPLKLHNTSKIHISKAGYQILTYLERNNLAIDINDSYPWINVERVTANRFMAYLSIYLANYGDNEMTPMTDSTPNLAVFSEEYPKCAFQGLSYEEQMRMELLEGIIPVPKDVRHIELQEIVEFKERHGDLAKAYRKKVEEDIISLSFIDDEDERQFKLKKYKEDKKEQLEELLARYKERNWGKIIFGSMCGLGAATIPGIRAISTGDITTGMEALPGIIGAVYTAYEGRLQKQKMILESPAAYAFFVSKEFLT